MKQLQALLNPKSIAIIGASNDQGKITGRPIEYMKRYGYEGKIFPVNPKYQQIQGLRAYPSILDINENIDLAMIALPKEMVISTLEDCIQKQVKSVIIFSSGFAEMDDEGKAIQQKIEALIKKTGIHVIGPNCQGIVNLKTKSLASFSTSFAEGDLMNGSAAIISQSGAVAGMIYNTVKDYGIGAKYWATTGNESGLSVADLIHAVVEDEDIRVIQIYMEDVKDSVGLKMAAEKAIKLKKPILALKSGRTAEGQKAASSHTGAIAGNDLVFDAFFRKYGIVRVDNIIESAAFSQFFRMEKKPNGKRVAVITNSGGLGVMLVDQCQEMDLDIATFSDDTLRGLKDVLPVFASVTNPIDITAQLLHDKNLLKKTLPILLKDPGVDFILFGLGTIGKGYDIPSIIQDISNAQMSGDKIIAVSWVGSHKGVIEQFGKQGVPAFNEPNLCAKAVAKFVQYHHFLKNEVKLDKTEYADFTMETKSWVKDKKAKSYKGFISEYESKSILGNCGFPLAQEEMCQNEEEVIQAAHRIGFPVVLKISSAEIMHKTEIGGVIVNIHNEATLKRAFQEISSTCAKFIAEKKNDGFLVQEMVESGFEISLGYKDDPVFGPVMMVASGGVYIEVLKDFQLLIPPVDFITAKNTVESLKMSPVLKGIRGKEKLDIDALSRCIVLFSEFIVQANGVLDEVDLNPVICLEEGSGVKVVDSLMKLKI